MKKLLVVLLYTLLVVSVANAKPVWKSFSFGDSREDIKAEAKREGFTYRSEHHNGLFYNYKTYLVKFSYTGWDKHLVGISIFAYHSLDDSKGAKKDAKLFIMTIKVHMPDSTYQKTNNGGYFTAPTSETLESITYSVDSSSITVCYSIVSKKYLEESIDKDRERERKAVEEFK